MIRYNFSAEIANIFLDRPQRAHAYTPDMLLELQQVLEKLNNQTVCIISSTGEKHFCAGADKDTLSGRKAEDALTLVSQKVFDFIARSDTIFIAAMNGPAVAGGCELALACDLRVAHPRTFFSLPEVSLGLIPAAGGCTRLVKLLGTSIAKGVILGGGRISSEQAERWGLVHRISAEPLEEASKWAQEILKKDALALRLAKSVLNEPSLLAERLAEALLYERKKEGL